MTRRRRFRTVQIGLGLALLATLVGPNGARAQSSSELGAIAGSSAASSLHALYTPKGLIPTAALVDLGVPDALTTISGGPQTFARASVADPGEVLANPDALLSQAGSGYPPGSIPPYPYRATASSAVGQPASESAPAPGLDAKATAEPTEAHAIATMPAFDGAAIARVGSTKATTSTSITGNTVTLHARSETNGFDLLAGLIRIDSVVVDLTATGDGSTTTTSGGTTVTGASFAGMPATIDKDGIHLSGTGAPDPSALNDALRPLLGQGVDNVNTALAAAGVHITALAPVEAGTATNKERSAYGVQIALDFSSTTVPVLEQLLSALPYVPPLAPGAPGLSDLIAIARSHEIVGIDVGRGRVALDARPRPPVPPSPAELPSTLGDLVAPVPGSAEVVPIDAAAAPAPLAASPSRSTPASASLPRSGGLAALVLLALLAASIAGDRLSVAAGWLLPEADPQPCPRTGR